MVDIQGVGDLYTDPAVHSMDHQGFGSGNMGPEGMLNFFLTHRCTPLCQCLGLHPFRVCNTEKEPESSAGVNVDSAAPIDAEVTVGAGKDPPDEVSSAVGHASRGSRAETLDLPLGRMNSVGQGLGAVADEDGLQPVRVFESKGGTDAALGQLHAKLAMHYLRKATQSAEADAHVSFGTYLLYTANSKT